MWVTEFRRVQILLTPLQYQYLQERAKRQDSNISAIVRELVQAEMEERRQTTEDDPFWKVVGMVAGDNPDASIEHDHCISTAHQKGKVSL
jgi:hypothetical protein